MQSLFVLSLLAIAFGVAAASTPHTDAFESHLTQVVSNGNSLKGCIVKVTHPIAEAAHFADDVVKVENLINKLEGRLTSTIDIIEAVMVIPYVGAFASPVLGPATTVLNTINNGLKTVTKEIDKVVAVIRRWTAPLKTIQNDINILNSKITQVLQVVGRVRDGTVKVDACVERLPAGTVRSHAETAMEKVTSVVDHVPNALLTPLQTVNHGCSQVEGFLHKLHVVRRKRSLPSLSKVIDVLSHIDGAFGPLGHFLDSVNSALSKKICLMGDIIKIGEKVVSGIEHVGKEVIEGAEHVANEIAKGTVNAANKVAEGTVNVANKVAEGTKDAVNTIKNTAETAVHKVGDFFHHIFGRRSVDKRRVDICVSINDALKLVNGVTGGMMNAARKFMTDIFHGKLPFKIPGLTSDVLNLGKFLKPFGVSVPSLSSVLHLAEDKVTAAIHMDTLAKFVSAIPQCKAAITG